MLELKIGDYNVKIICSSTVVPESGYTERETCYFLNTLCAYLRDAADYNSMLGYRALARDCNKMKSEIENDLKRRSFYEIFTQNNTGET